jgi:hypothetical protein
MSTRSLLVVLVCALFVAGFCLWRIPSLAPRAGDTAAPAATAAKSAAVPAPELSAADSVANLKSSAAAPARSAPTAREREAVASAGGPPPITDFGAASSLESAHYDPIPAADREFFASKYASSNADARRRAHATLDALFLAHKSGEETKANALTDEEAAALEREILWLDENPGN